MALPETPLDRRTVLAGAAWSVPVIAVAVGAPAAAASTGTLEVDFVAAVLQLKRETSVAGVIAITNTGDAPLTRSVTITLPELAEESDGTYGTAYDRRFGATVDNGAGQNVPVTNLIFTPTWTMAPDRTLVLSAVDHPFPAGTTFIAVFFTWPTDNTEVDGFIIAGSFTIGGVTKPLRSVQLLPPQT